MKDMKQKLHVKQYRNSCQAMRAVHNGFIGPLEANLQKFLTKKTIADLWKLQQIGQLRTCELLITISI